MAALLAPHSTSSAIVGSVAPRLWTRPLRRLTRATSFGYDVADFARDTLGRPLDPWQRWLVIHAGELLPDGRPRFRYVLVVVARQNGKTEVLVILSLFWLFVDQVPLVLGTSTNLDYAKESWEKAVSLAETVDDLSAEIPKRGGVRRTNGEQTFTTLDGCRYKIAASNRRGGRSLTVHRLILDELREHDSWEAWNAATPAMNAVPDAQAWAISNQGDDKSVVLNSLRNAALRYIETGEGDPRLGIFEWSAPKGSDPTDPAALAAANPNLARRVHLDSLMGAAVRAKDAGGDELAGFLTEVLCIQVPMLDPAVDADAWAACAGAAGLDDVRARVALVVDVALDGAHASAYAAAVTDGGKVRVDAVKAWEGRTCTRQLRRDLPGLVTRVRPAVVGWFPNGPAAAIAAELAERRRAGWPPPGVTVEEIRRNINAVCMGFAEQVTAGELEQPDDPLLTAHVTGASKLWVGDGWRFARKGGHVDAAYAAAGAVHLARTLPPPPPTPKVILPRSARRPGRKISGQETAVP